MTFAPQLDAWGAVHGGRVSRVAVLCRAHGAELRAQLDALGVRLVRIDRIDLVLTLADDEEHGRISCFVCSSSRTLTVSPGAGLATRDLASGGGTARA